MFLIYFIYLFQNFNSKDLSEQESKCISQCSEKFMKLTQRVGFRFTEYQAIKNNANNNVAPSTTVSK